MRILSRVLIALALLIGAACSDDESTLDEGAEQDEESTTSSAGALDPDEINASASEYCATWADLRELAGNDVTALDNEGRKDHYGRLLPVAERLLTQADSEIEDAVEAAVDATREAAETGSTTSFETPDMQEIQERLAEYAQERCRA